MSSGASAAGPEADPEAGVVVGRASSSGASVRVTAADATLSAALREFIRARASTSPRPSPAPGTHPASSSPASAARDVSARVSDLERLLEINRELNRLDAAAASDDDDATRGSHGDRLGGRAAPRADGSDEGRASSSAAASFGFDHRGASRWFEHTAPVLVILGLAFAISHAVGILAYAWSTLALMRANEATKRLARDFRKEDAAGDEESIAIAGDEESIGGQMSGVSGATAGTTAAAGASSRGGGERGDESASSAAAAASTTNRSRRRRSIRATRDAAAVILLCVVSLVVLRRVFSEDEFWARVAFPFDLGAGALRRLFSSAFFFRGVKTTDGGARNTPGYGYYSFGWENPKLGGGGANDAGSSSSGAFFAALWTSAMADVVAKFVAVAAKCASVLVGDWRAERDAKTYSSSSRHHSTSTNTARDAAATRRAARRARRVLGARLSLLEHATLLWRAAIPAPIWFAYFRAGAGLGRAASAACAGAYLAHKGRVLFAAARAVGEAHAALGAACASDRVGERVRLAPGEAEVWVGGGGGGVSGGGGSARANDEGSFANDGASAGIKNTHARALGDECAICQEPYRDPTRLRCAHVFCEGCVAEWFDRDERTCPLCRAVVVDGVGSRAGDAHRDGGTVMFAHAF